MLTETKIDFKSINVFSNVHPNQPKWTGVYFQFNLEDWEAHYGKSFVDGQVWELKNERSGVTSKAKGWKNTDGKTAIARYDPFSRDKNDWKVDDKFSDPAYVVPVVETQTKSINVFSNVHPDQPKWTGVYFQFNLEDWEAHYGKSFVDGQVWEVKNERSGVTSKAKGWKNTDGKTAIARYDPFSRDKNDQKVDDKFSDPNKASQKANVNDAKEVLILFNIRKGNNCVDYSNNKFSLVTCNSKTSQQFSAKNIGAASYIVKIGGTEKILSVDHQNNGGKLVASDDAGFSWWIVNDKQGFQLFTNTRCLENGLYIWDKNSGDHQYWDLVQVGTTNKVQGLLGKAEIVNSKWTMISNGGFCLEMNSKGYGFGAACDATKERQRFYPFIWKRTEYNTLLVGYFENKAFGALLDMPPVGRVQYNGTNVSFQPFDNARAQAYGNGLLDSKKNTDGTYELKSYFTSTYLTPKDGKLYFNKGDDQVVSLYHV